MTAGKSTMLSNATALMTATIATSVIGIFFWALSVRLYDTANVGLATAQISAATLVAMVGQLSLGLLLTRFLPTSGRFTPWILKRVFIVVSGLSTVLAAAFVALGFANDYLAGWPEKLFFIVAVPALALFMLQDSALLGLGSAKIIPVENVLFSVAKLILLPVFAGVAAAIGIFASWVIPAGLAVVGVLIYIKVKHLSNPETLSGGTELPQRSVLWPMLGKQFVGTMVAQAAFLIVPLEIIYLLGAESSGYLSIPWMIGGAFTSLTANITMSFSYEVRKGQHVTPQMLRRLLTLLGLVSVVAALACAALAPLVLAILAPGYADQATFLLRLVALAVPFQAMLRLLTTFWWLEGNFELFAIVPAISAVLTLGLTWYLAPRVGLDAAGIATLIAAVALAAGTAWPLARRLILVHRGGGHSWTPAVVD